MLTYNSYKRVYLKYIIMFKNVIEQIIELEQVRYTVHGIMHSAYLSYLYIYISLIKLMVLIYHVAHHLDQNEISSEGGQDTSAWQISAHSSLAFSRKCLEIATFTCFTSQNAAKMRKINSLSPKCNKFQRWSGCRSISNWRQFPPCFFKENPWKPQNSPKIRKMNSPWPKSTRL